MSLKMVSDRIVLLMFFYNKKRWKNVEHVQKRKKRGKNKGTFLHRWLSLISGNVSYETVVGNSLKKITSGVNYHLYYVTCFYYETFVLTETKAK